MLPRSTASSAGGTRLRVLIPSWRFFDGIGEAPELWMRTGAAPDRYGPWMPVVVAPPRNLLSLVWNPRGNLALACHTLLERLQTEIEERPAVPPSAFGTYHLVLNLVRSRVPTGAGLQVVQFRLVLRERAGEFGEQELLRSTDHPC